MIEVFKTNVQKEQNAKRIITILLELLPGTKINFDLEDCDKILRVKNENNFNSNLIISKVEEAGFICQILTD